LNELKRAASGCRFYHRSWSARHRLANRLQLTSYYERGWRATFYTTGMEHSPTSATGTGWERTPWHATQRAAWDALTKSEARDR